AASETDEAKALVAAIRDQVKTLDALTEEYLTFARFPRPHFEEDAVNDLVRELADFIRPVATRQGLTVRVETDGDVPLMEIDRGADHRGARRRGPVDEPAGQRHALHDPAAAQEDAWLSRRTSWSPTTIRGCARASSARSPARGTAWWSPPTGRPRSSGCRAAASISCSRISRCPGFPASSCC